MATLNEKINLARDLFGTSKTDAPSVNRISGTATADSSDGTVTVQLDDGDVIELGTIGSVRSGQTVTVHVQGNSAQVIAAEGWGDAIQTTVDEAAEVANATNQHFWSDDNGAHITEVTQDEWNDSSDPNYHSGYNSLWNSLGLLFRRALNNLVAITQGAVTFYDGSGNNAANVTASFGSSGAQVGKSGDAHIVMDYRSLQTFDKGGAGFFTVADMRDDTGFAEITSVFAGDGERWRFNSSPSANPVSGVTVTVSDSSGGARSVYNNGAFLIVDFATPPTAGATITVEYTTDSADAKFYTVGTRMQGAAIGAMSYAEGRETTASGYAAHAEGHETTASQWAAHAEGYQTVASLSYAHAEGQETTASHLAAHAEGWGSEASGQQSHAEGAYTVASGTYSHAQNEVTIAAGQSQTAIGKYNVADTTSALIIGNGAGPSNRSNALTVDWNGNVSLGGGLSLYGGTTFGGMFSTDAVSTTIGSISAGASKWVTIDTTRANHAAIALVGYYINGANMLVPYCARMSGTDAQFALRNSGTSASSSSATIEAQVLYVKTA